VNRDDDVVRAWRESAPFWEKHRETVRLMFEPVTRALVEDAHIAAGMRVLDIACGSGEPGLTLAEIVESTGCVTCTDIISEMVASAQRAAACHNLTNIKFHQCAADSLLFPNGSFDATVCRFGVMFFPEPLAGLSEMLRVTKQDGRVALAVWHNIESNPFFHVVTEILARYVESPPDDPQGPGAFRFAEPGTLARILEQAGAADVRERVLDFPIAAPISPHEFWTVRSEISDTVREKLAQIDQAQHALVKQHVIEAARVFFPQGQMKFPAKAIIVSGAKNNGRHPA
jgi:ubiquinone/menaquinone biosynthesis C-methylase UbiE